MSLSAGEIVTGPLVESIRHRSALMSFCRYPSDGRSFLKPQCFLLHRDTFPVIGLFRYFAIGLVLHFVIVKSGMKTSGGDLQHEITASKTGTYL